MLTRKPPTVEGTLQDCAECCKQAEKYWSSDVTLNYKLYWTKEEFQTRVEFMILKKYRFNQNKETRKTTERTNEEINFIFKWMKEQMNERTLF